MTERLAKKSHVTPINKKVRRSRCVLPSEARHVSRRSGESDRSVKSKVDIKKIQGLLKSKTTKGVTTGLSLLESLGATTTDYELVFIEPVIRAIVRMRDAETLLATAKHLLPQVRLCTRFIEIAAESFCKATERQRLRLLHGLFKQPFCFDAWHADPARHCLDLDMSDGTVLWDVLHRELLAAGRIKVQYRESQEEGLSTCIVHSLNGIHLAGYYRDRGEGRPADLPCHTLAAGGRDATFPDPHGWFEVAWAVSDENLTERILRRTSEVWDAHDWAWDKGKHLIIAMLWSWFTAECIDPSETARLGAALGSDAMPLRKRKTLFRWTEKGSRTLVTYSNELLGHRTFRDPGIGSIFAEWPNSPYLPWQYSESSWENELEARWRKAKHKYASYASLAVELKQLAFYAAVALRDAARRLNTLSPAWVTDKGATGKRLVPVIEGLANHALICLALHPATPPTIVKALAGDSYKPVASAATDGRKAKGDQRSPADKMKDIVDCVVRGTGGRSRTNKVSDDTFAIAKRLSRYWSHWKQEDSLNDVDAVNVDEPSTNENRMRAVAIGVAVARGWIVPTDEGTALMRKNLIDLDAGPPEEGTDDDEKG